MPRDQANPALAWETLLELDAVGPRVEQLERAVREAVRSGRAPAGAALPPSRRLAEQLGVSRWVVTEAYGQLVAEGVLEARTGSATRVARDPPAVTGVATVPPAPAVPSSPRPRTWSAPSSAPERRAGHDLAPGIPD
ncbi:winged helix-turn-helix transcriptional regulator, partial [Actinotalea ferrariae]|uniref:GntR family transcriptional regulator n=1 Tax=Actinotalea ferrariae TaxID=1386098 RepID=UPI001C8CF1D8